MADNMNPNQRYKVALSETENVDIDIYVMSLRAEGLDLVPWVSTYILANQLHKLNIPVPPKESTDIPILELGAGIGLVALAGAMLWQRQVMITDLEPLVPGLQHIADMNKDLLTKRGGSADAGTLDWFKPDELILHNGKRYDANQTKANIIMAADTIYDEDHPGLLGQTVLRWLAPGPDSRFISCQALRVAYLDYIREFWELLEEGGLEVVDEGRHEADAEWDDERLIEWSVWRWKQ